MRQLEKVNKELWLVLSMFVIALLLNVLIDAQRMVLYFYTLPTLASAYLYGRRHATLTAFAQRPAGHAAHDDVTGVFGARRAALRLPARRWLDLAAWGGTLIVTGYLMGTLYEHKNAQLQRAARDLSRRADDPSALHLEGRIHRTPFAIACPSTRRGSPRTSI